MKSRIVLVAAVVLAAGGIGFLAGRGGAPSVSQGAPTAIGTAKSNTEAANTASAGTASASRTPTRAHADASLPDIGTPLRQIHDDLVRRAADGDARAACRLAAEHERCESNRLQLRAIESQEEQQARWLDGQREIPEQIRARVEQQRKRFESQRVTLGQALVACEAAPQLSPDARARYWRQAALAGHVPSMRHYASGSAFRLHDLMDALPALQTYRREAESIAVRAATGGDVVSMYALALAYANYENGRRRSFLAQSITPDLPHALAWFSVLARHPAITALPPTHPVATTVARHHAELQAAATADEAAQASRLAAAVQVRGGEPRDAALLAPGGGVRDTGPEACSADTFAGQAAR